MYSSFPIFISLISVLCCISYYLQNNIKQSWCIWKSLYCSWLSWERDMMLPTKHDFYLLGWDIGTCHVNEVSIYFYVIERFIFIYICYQEWSLHFFECFSPSNCTPFNPSYKQSRSYHFWIQYLSVAPHSYTGLDAAGLRQPASPTLWGLKAHMASLPRSFSRSQGRPSPNPRLYPDGLTHGLKRAPWP